MIFPFLRTPYNYDSDMVSEETGLRCEDPSLAQQHQKEDADINTIVRRFGLTGQLPTGVRVPTYGDFTEVGTYQECLTAVKEAEKSFMALPAEIRAKFENDPEKFIDYFAHEENRAEAEKLGLVIPKPAASVPAAGTPAAGAAGTAAGTPAAGS